MILDTNAISAIGDKDKALLALLAKTELLYLPVVTLAEYRFGLLGSRRPEIGEKLIDGLEKTIPILELSNKTALYYATIAHELKIAGYPIPQNDIWLAALAREHRQPILSKDKHFDRVIRITRIDWGNL